jgi:hypothetical protein
MHRNAVDRGENPRPDARSTAFVRHAGDRPRGTGRRGDDDMYSDLDRARAQAPTFHVRPPS